MGRLIFSAILFYLLTLFFTPQVQAAKFRLSAPSGTLQRGGPVSLIINIDTEGGNLAEAATGASYDPSLLRFNSVTAGNTFPQVSSSVISEGKIKITGTNAQGFSGNGIFATLNFTIIAQSPGSAQFCTLFDVPGTIEQPPPPPGTALPTLNLLPSPPPDPGDISTLCYPVKINGDQNSKLDLIFFAGRYQNKEEFLNDVRTSINFLEATNLPKAVLNKINYWALTDLSVDFIDYEYSNRIHRIIYNKDVAAVQKSRCRADTSIVIFNLPGYSDGTAFRGIGSCVTRSALSAVPHELGHSIAFLGDEYNYGSPLSTDWVARGYNVSYNCSQEKSQSQTEACPKWAGLFTGVGCIPVCGYTNLFRSTQESIMNVGIRDYNPPSIRGWEMALQNYE